MNTYKLIEVRGKHNSEAEHEVVELILDWLNGETDFDKKLRNLNPFINMDQLSLFGDEAEMGDGLNRGLSGVKISTPAKLE